MITFKCPECGEKMEVSDRKAGMEIECLECGEMVEVPGKVRKRKSGSGSMNSFVGKNRLTLQEYLLYGAVFVAVPMANVLISSLLYYMWREKEPTKAFQINQLGFVILGLQVLTICCACVLPAIFFPQR
jgi:DNA-directed RNA polymerase subunit RPC12/RpoP